MTDPDRTTASSSTTDTLLHTRHGVGGTPRGRRAPTAAGRPALAAGRPAPPPAGTVDEAELRKRADAAAAAVRATATKLRAAPRGPRRGCAPRSIAVAELAGVDALRRRGRRRRRADRAGRLVASCSPRAGSAGGTRCAPGRAGRAAPTDATALVGRWIRHARSGAHQPVLPVFTLVRPGGAGRLARGSAAPARRRRHRADHVAAPRRARAAGARPAVRAAHPRRSRRRRRRRPGRRRPASAPPGRPMVRAAVRRGRAAPAGTVGVVAVTPPAASTRHEPTAGLFVDAWAEVIPAAEHTAGRLVPLRRARRAAAPGDRARGTPPPGPAAAGTSTPARHGARDGQLAHLRTLSLQGDRRHCRPPPGAVSCPTTTRATSPSVSFKQLLLEVAEAQKHAHRRDPSPAASLGKD